MSLEGQLHPPSGQVEDGPESSGKDGQECFPVRNVQRNRDWGRGGSAEQAGLSLKCCPKTLKMEISLQLLSECLVNRPALCFHPRSESAMCILAGFLGDPGTEEVDS